MGLQRNPCFGHFKSLQSTLHVLRLRHATLSSRCRFFTWTGPDLFDSSLAGTQGVLTYAVEIQTAGRYEILIRNLHNDPVRTRTSTSFWTTSHEFSGCVPPYTRRVLCSTWCPWPSDADWGLESNVVTNLGLQDSTESNDAWLQVMRNLAKGHAQGTPRDSAPAPSSDTMAEQRKCVEQMFRSGGILSPGRL